MLGSEAELLKAAQGGDRDAIGALLALHEARVYRFGMKMCRHPEDAEDILQETLLAAARGVGDFKNDASLSTWLFSIARSFCIKARRKRRVYTLVEDDAPNAASPFSHVADPQPGPEDTFSVKEMGAVLDRTLDTLEPSQREVLLLRDVEGLSAKEVAVALGLSEQAVKSRLHRGRLTLRQMLSPHFERSEKEADDAPANSASTCPDVLKLYSKHLENEISSDMCKAMEEHLQTCAKCRGACHSLKHTLAICRTAKVPQVPARVQASVRKALKGLLPVPIAR